MTKKNKLIIFIFGLIAFGLIADFSLAQDIGAEIIENNLGNTLGSAGTDPRLLIARIIQIALSFLGIIAILLTLYAGFTWMSSGGDEDKISRAKQILKNAVIGLVIILSSWAITTYLISKITGSLGSALNPGFSNNAPRIFSDPGFGAIGACSVDSVYPEHNQTDVARNTTIVISFKEEIGLQGLCADNAGKSCTCGEAGCDRINPKIIRIYKTDSGDACGANSCPDINSNTTEVMLTVFDDNKTLFLTPIGYLGDPSKNIKYSIKLTDNLKKTNGDSMFKSCSSNLFTWSFEVSSRLDLTPPQVVYGSLFPRPDNEKDLQNQLSPARPAEAAINVLACPQVFSPSEIVSVKSDTSSPAASATPLNYQGEITSFIVQIATDSKDKALLFDAGNQSNLLGSAEFDAQGNARFSPYFIFKASERNFGNSWIVTLKPEKVADTLTIGDYVYTFASAAGANNILRPTSCTADQQATLIREALSGDQLVTASKSNNSVVLTAKISGTSGNNIRLSSSNQAALQIRPFAGGVERRITTQNNDQKDVPMNTVIQLNFNEPVNPLRIAGLASEVSDYIRVVNYEATAKSAGAACQQDAECKSYNCSGDASAKTCRGDYLAGRFVVSNSFKTLEFISDKECGVNGCGEKIYCLPASSHLAIEMRSADLRTCSSNDDCLPLAPFTSCAETGLGYKTCQNEDSRNYPAASSELSGLSDLAFNSFDGNRNLFSDGPLDYYSDNFVFEDQSNDDKWDNYRFSFYVNDQINLTPPKIELITPGQNATGTVLAEPIKITWNTLMMNSTLKSGNTIINTGKNKIEHKLINLQSLNLAALGYWITNENLDTNSDGEPDKTVTWVNHSVFSESLTYKVQVGSGVKDIYQNCFKPSDGDGCSGVSLENPSCCFGQATNSLDESGGCR